MNKKIKIIFVGLFFVLLLALGIYLYPRPEPMFVDQGPPGPAKKNVRLSHKHVPNPAPEEKPLPSVPPETAAAPPKPADTKEKKASPYVSYPESILDMLGIDKERLIAERDKFKNTVIHVEWMDHVNDVLKNLDPEKRDAIIQNHTTLLYVKDLLNKAYLSGKIDHETFIKAVADLMKWHQKTYASMLTEGEYEALFELKPEAADDTIDQLLESAPKYSFILNQDIPAEEVMKQVPGYKLEEVDTHFKKMLLDRDEIGKKINAGEITLEQAREALYKSQQAFIAKCKEILTEGEINTIFGSVAALESGGTQTTPPAVLGDADKQELGFEIENPDTSIDMVKAKLTKDKIEDLKFFYQQREKEREELIKKLEAGEITEEDIENTSNEMDSAFKENCRSILTDEEYKLIFEKPAQTQSTQPTGPTESEASKESNASTKPEASTADETLKNLTEQKITEEESKK